LPNLFSFYFKLRQQKEISVLPASTVHPRRAAGRTDMGTAGRRVRIDVFFFKTIPYLSHTRARRGYTGTTGTGTGYSGTRGGSKGRAGTRVLDYSGTGTVITVSEPL
jgi:hypothetical protein